MGQYFVAAFTMFAAYGLYCYARTSKLADTLWLSFGACLALVLLWGVFVPSVSTIQVPAGASNGIRVWQIGGSGLLGWLVIASLSAVLQRKR